jgi:hypothetical protein
MTAANSDETLRQSTRSTFHGRADSSKASRKAAINESDSTSAASSARSRSDHVLGWPRPCCQRRGRLHLQADIAARSCGPRPVADPKDAILQSRPRLQAVQQSAGLGKERRDRGDDLHRPGLVISVRGDVAHLAKRAPIGPLPGDKALLHPGAERSGKVSRSIASGFAAPSSSARRSILWARS